MTAKRDGAKVAGLAAVGCAACCAGPIIGFLAAIGLGTALVVFLYGVAGLAVASVGGLWWLRRRRRQQACTTPTTMPVTMTATRTRTDA